MPRSVRGKELPLEAWQGSGRRADVTGAYTMHRLPQQSQGRTCLRCDLVRLQRRAGAVGVRCGMARRGVGGACVAWTKGTSAHTKAQAIRAKASAARGHTVGNTKGVYITHLPCAPQCRRAAVCSCRRALPASAPVVPVHLRWGTRCTHSGVLYILAYCEYSCTPKGTVSTRTCGMRRFADVIFRLDRRRRWCRRTCGGVLGVLTVGYSTDSPTGRTHTYSPRVL